MLLKRHAPHNHGNHAGFIMTIAADEAPLKDSVDTSESSTLPLEDLQDAVIRFAGNSQDGIQTVGGFLARLAGRSARRS